MSETLGGYLWERFKAEGKRTAHLFGWTLVLILSLNGAVIGAGVISVKAGSTAGMELVGWCFVGMVIMYWSACGLWASGKRIVRTLREDWARMRQAIEDAARKEGV